MRGTRIFQSFLLEIHMRDPSIVAFEIRYPWWHLSFGGRKYHDSFITVWHVDPESDGSDDSCGWSRVKIPEGEAVRVEAEAKGRIDWYLTYPPDSVESLIYTTYREVAWNFNKRALVPGDYPYILDLTHNLHDSLYQWASSLLLMFVGRERTHDLEYDFTRFYFQMLRLYRTHHRPWYKHPKYHFWHYRLQVHPLQSFKRRAFSKCCQCGKGFSWGYSPVCGLWDSDGPAWFKSERQVYHLDCRDHKSGGCQTEKTEAP